MPEKADKVSLQESQVESDGILYMCSVPEEKPNLRLQNVRTLAHWIMSNERIANIQRLL